MTPPWIVLLQRLVALAQTGIEYTKDRYDTERYSEIISISASLTTLVSEVDVASMAQDLISDTGYATPKIDVRAAVFKDDKILLVKERADDLWTLPGGWADVGQSARESVEREVLEESGYVVRATKLAAVYDRNKHPHTPRIFHAFKLFFICELESGESQISDETSAVAFFSEDELPELSVDRVLPFQIREMFHQKRNPVALTVFD